MLSGYWNGGQGCLIETLAELIGDTPTVAFDHYGREWGQHCQAPLWAAIGADLEPGKASAAKQPRNEGRGMGAASHRRHASRGNHGCSTQGTATSDGG